MNQGDTGQPRKDHNINVLVPSWTSPNQLVGVTGNGGQWTKGMTIFLEGPSANDT